MTKKEKEVYARKQKRRFKQVKNKKHLKCKTKLQQQSKSKKALTLQQALLKFTPISLSELNKKAQLMDRIETKYVISREELPKLLKKLTKTFDVLTIDGLKIFSYDNIYMDTQDLKYYKQHIESASERIKMRTRRYLDSNLTFFEFKYKNSGEMTKYRYNTIKEMHGIMDADAYAFCNKIYQKTHGKGFEDTVKPTISTAYKRITLVHKKGGERITIDLDLAFAETENSEHQYVMPPIAIVEVKTKQKHTKTHKILKKLNTKEISSCSKYCLAHHYINPIVAQGKDTKFKDIISFAEKIRKKEQKRLEKLQKREERKSKKK